MVLAFKRSKRGTLRVPLRVLWELGFRISEAGLPHTV